MPVQPGQERAPEYLNIQGTTDNPGDKQKGGTLMDSLFGILGGGAPGLIGGAVDWLNKILGGHKGGHGGGGGGSGGDSNYITPNPLQPTDTSNLQKIVDQVEVFKKQAAKLQRDYDAFMRKHPYTYNKALNTAVDNAYKNLTTSQKALAAYKQQMGIAKKSSDPSGLTNTMQGGMASGDTMTNMFGNLVRGGASGPTTGQKGFTGGGTVPGKGKPAFGSGSSMFAPGLQGPSTGQGQYGQSATGSGNYGQVEGNLGHLGDWNINFQPMFDTGDDPNLGMSSFDVPMFGAPQAQSATPGQSSIAGLGGISNMPMNPGVGQGGIALGGQGYGGGFGNKQSAMGQMFPGEELGFGSGMSF